MPEQGFPKLFKRLCRLKYARNFPRPDQHKITPLPVDNEYCELYAVGVNFQYRPHACGDVPGALPSFKLIVESSPRPWGWAEFEVGERPARDISPRKWDGPEIPAAAEDHPIAPTRVGMCSVGHLATHLIPAWNPFSEPLTFTSVTRARPASAGSA